jgi:rSAM/selenodomain-associated transferase 2
VIIQEKVPAFPLSIVIPALNEAQALASVLASLENQGADPPFEVLLVDGGSTDATIARFKELTRAWPAPALLARWITCPRPGRATQMNMGAAAAGGKALLFLHADTRLPRGAARAVVRALEDPAVAGGGFRHSFDSRGALLRLISIWATARSRLTGVHLGDQAAFVGRATFEAIGGFPEVPLFEDLFLARRLKKAGRIVTLPLTVETSARRLLACGVLRTGLQFAWMRIRLGFGADIEELKAHYPDVRSNRAVPPKSV